MPDFNAQIAQINANRQAFSIQQRQLYDLQLRQQKGEAVDPLTLKAATDKVASAKNNLQASISTLHQGQTLDSLVNQWDADVPLMMLPIRLQTRIVTTQNQAESPSFFMLLVRVYPDDIFIQTHEDLLTDDEVQAAKIYWSRIRLAEQPTVPNVQQIALKKEAWREVSTQFGGGRSLYISKRTTPLNRIDLGKLTTDSAIQYDAAALTTKSKAWTEAAKTSLLPDRFQVMVYNNSVEGSLPHITQMGNLIPDTLQVGIDPLNDNGSFKKKNGEILAGDDVKWMTDFVEAERVGMGIKVPLPMSFFPAHTLRHPQLRAAYLRGLGISRIVVVGVLNSADKVHSSVLVKKLFENHLYSSKGLSFLKKGTPTNNTDEENSAWSIYNDPLSINYYDGYKAFSDEDSICDGVKLAKALGVLKSVFQAVPNAEKQDNMVAQQMNRAIYPATIGHYFDNLMAGVVTNQAELKSFFNAYVVGSGNLPSFRVGRQPYGVVLSGEYQKYAATEEGTFYQALTRVLTTLDGVWQSLVKEIPRVGKGTDPALTLTDILSLHAHSVDFAQQWFYPASMATLNLGTFNYAQTQANNRALVLEFLRTVGFQGSAAPFVGGLVQHASKVSKPLSPENIVKPDSFEENTPLSNGANFNYLLWLSELTSLRELEVLPQGSRAESASLLMLMMRQSYLKLFSEALISFVKLPIFKATEARNIIRVVRNFQTTVNASAFNLTPNNPPATVWEIFNTVIALDELHPAIGVETANKFANKTLSDMILSSGLVDSVNRFFMQQNNPLVQNTLKPILEFYGLKVRLKYLANIPAAALERALVSHFDCVAHRLDAWQEGVIARRLDKNRAKPAKAEGVYIGAFGWVENLKLTGNKTGTEGGFIHAPSPTHATTAAVLKSAFLNHKTPNGQSLFALNLHSRRLQQAQQVLERMRNGERLESILGYHFERALQDISATQNNAAANFILIFRKIYPITAVQLPPNPAEKAVEVVSNPTLVNGLAIAEEFLQTPATPSVDPKTIWRSRIGIAATDPSLPFIQKAIGELADTLDSLKDLLSAETAYQMAQGNFSAVGASLEALKKGSVPQNLGFLEPSRQNALQFSNRVAVHFDTEGVSSVIPQSPRATAEGGLNRWCTQLLGFPQLIGCTARHLSEAGIESSPTTLTLADLQIQPIDFVCWMIAPAQLESRLAFFYRQKLNLSDDITIRLDFAITGTPQVKPIAKILPIASTIQRLIATARPLTAQDYVPNGSKDVAAVIDAPEFLARINQSLINLTNLVASIKTLALTTPMVLPDGGGTLSRLRDVFAVLKNTKSDATAEDWLPPIFKDATVLRDKLMLLSAYGVADAFPKRVEPKNPTAIVELVRQAESIITATERNIAEINAALVDLPSASEVPLAHAEALMRLGKQIFYGSMPFLPRFKYTNPVQLNDSIARKAELLKGAPNDPTPPAMKAEEWLQGVARVRSKLSLWETLRFMTATAEASLDLVPLQVPTDGLIQRLPDGTLKPVYTWLAVEFSEGISARRDVVSIVATGAIATQTDKMQTGLLLDEWNEAIPTDEELTALTFHYNQPNTEAPQTVLLSVCPLPTWSWDVVVGSVIETLRRAKLRTVDIARIKQAASVPNSDRTTQAVASLLPMLMAPVNIQQHAFTLDFGMMDKTERQRMSSKTGDALGHYQIWQE